MTAAAVQRTAWYAAWLRPRGVPSDYQQSPSYQRLATAVDTFAFWLTVVFNVVLLKCQTRVPIIRVPLILRMCPLCFWIPCAVLQHLWCRLRPDSYFRWRHELQLAVRLVRLAYSLILLLFIRAAAASPSASLAIQQLTAQPRALLPPPAAAFSLLMMVSGALQPIMASASNCLPFRPQLLVHALTLLVLVAVAAAPAATVLDMAPFRDELTDMCTALNSLAAITVGGAAASSHAQVPFLQESCHSSASLLLVLFVDIWVGFVLPLYCSHRLDQYLAWQLHAEQLEQLEHQRRQQRQQQRQLLKQAKDAPGQGAGAPAAQDSSSESAGAVSLCSGLRHHQAGAGLSRLAADLGILVALVPATWLMVVLLHLSLAPALGYEGRPSAR